MSVADGLKTFKRFYPSLKYVQELTADGVSKAAKGKPIDWNAVTPADFAPETTTPISPCATAVGWVIFDVVCLAVGAVGLRNSAAEATAQAIAAAAAPVQSQLELIIAQMAAPEATTRDLAWGALSILRAIWTGGSLGAVFNAFVGSLTWYNMILYGVTGSATIVAILSTDGLAFAAEVVIFLATFGFLVSDSVAAVSACSLSTTAPPPAANPSPGPGPYEPSVAILTHSGNYLTVVNNGGLGGPNNASCLIHSDATQVGSWEKFTLVPIDATLQTFALRTATGNYVGATNGGGLGGPNASPSVIHTDATQVGQWESLVLIQQADGTYAIGTTSGFYIGAVNGGGLGGPNDASSIIHTDATQIGSWETFAFVNL